MRTIICGGPRSGKTLLARSGRFPGAVHETDSLIGIYSWGKDSEEVCNWMSMRGPWIIEGTTCARALRKWPEMRAEPLPIEIVVFILGHNQPLTSGQESMRKGILTVFRDVLPELQRQNIPVAYYRSRELCAELLQERRAKHLHSDQASPETPTDPSGQVR